MELDVVPIEAVSDAMIVVSHDSCVVAANGRADALFRVPPGGLLRVPIRRLVTTPLPEAAVIAGTQPVTQRAEAVRPDGSGFAADLLCAAGSDAGTPRTVITVRPLDEAHADDDLVLRALRESETSLETTLRSIGDGVIVTDARGVVTRMNPVAEQLTGWSFADACGEPLDRVFQIVNETTRALVESPVVKVFREGTVVGLANHTLLIARDGVERPIADSGAPIRDARGALAGVVMVFRDQTEEHATEKALRQSETRFRTLLEAAPDALVSIDADGRIVLVNKQVEALFGYVAEELIGQPIDLLVPQRLRSRHAEHRARYRAAPRARPMGSGAPLVGRRKDGSEFFVGVSLSHAETDAGLLATAAVRDVSTQVRTQEALANSEARFRTLVESFDDIIYTLDLEQRYSSFHGRWLASEGLRAEDFLGKTIVEVLGSEAGAVQDAAHKRALAGERVVYESTWNRGRSVRSFHTALSPLRDAQGQLMGAVGVGREITKLKQAQAQLVMTEHMASIGMLVAGVAHEINNPLTAVSVNLQLATAELAVRAQNDDSLAALQRDVTDAFRATQLVQTIVRDLLVFSRGSGSQEREPVSVHGVLEATLRIAHNEIRHRARLERDFREVPAVLASETRLAQVFLNLVMNAVQALPEGDAERNEIRVVTRIDDVGQVVIEVQDTGPGISPEVIENLFTPFFSTKPKGSGTGLGLAICQRIVTSFGGTIVATSKPGEGSVFRVSLPATHHAPASKSVAKPDAPVRSTRRGRVLIVDDDPVVASTVARVLRRDHDVVIAASGHDALERVRSGERYDVVVCDLMMPRMMGIELHAAIEALSREQAARIVFLSGGVFSPDTVDFLKQRSNPCLQKPFDPTELRAVVNAWVEHGAPAT